MDNWERLVWNQRDALLAGLQVTIEVCFISFACAIVGGLVLCLVRMYVRPLRPVAIAADRVLPRHADPRAAAVGELRVARDLRLADDVLPGRVHGARAAVERLSRRDVPRRHRGVPRGQREAAFAVGMSPLLVFRRIVLPQVLLGSAPAIVNQFTVIVKSSTLVSVITVQDLMFQSQKIVNIAYEPIEILTATAALYIAFIYVVSMIGKLLADRLRRSYGIAAH